jgi:NDP-sugar pyrophosphorylase family protein
MSAPALVVMAAGMGSRYGGAKQVDGVGPSEETLIEYGLYDARRAGFGRVVFITRKELSEAFSTLIARLPAEFDVRTVYQSHDQVPSWLTAPPRAKPWGTVQAVLTVRAAVDTPFVVINADDFYGRGAYEVAMGACRHAEQSGDYAIVGYRLDHVLSEHGSVARGVTRTEGRRLVWLDEVRDIVRTPSGITGLFPDGTRKLTGSESASMNCWVLTPSIFPVLDEEFNTFLKQHGHDPKGESALPEAINRLVQAGRARVNVIDAPGPWFGMTHPEDRPKVRAGLQGLVDQGVYPNPLWKR